MFFLLFPFVLCCFHSLFNFIVIVFFSPLFDFWYYLIFRAFIVTSVYIYKFFSRFHFPFLSLFSSFASNIFSLFSFLLFLISNIILSFTYPFSLHSVFIRFDSPINSLFPSFFLTSYSLYYLYRSMFVPSFCPFPLSISLPSLPYYLFHIQSLIRYFLPHSFYYLHGIYIPPFFIHALSPALFFHLSCLIPSFLSLFSLLSLFLSLFTISYIIFSVLSCSHIYYYCTYLFTLPLSLPPSPPALPAPHYQTFFPVNVPGAVREEGEQNLHHPLSSLSLALVNMSRVS